MVLSPQRHSCEKHSHYVHDVWGVVARGGLVLHGKRRHSQLLNAITFRLIAVVVASRLLNKHFYAHRSVVANMRLGVDKKPPLPLGHFSRQRLSMHF